MMHCGSLQDMEISMKGKLWGTWGSPGRTGRAGHMRMFVKLYGITNSRGLIPGNYCKRACNNWYFVRFKSVKNKLDLTNAVLK